MSTYIQTTDNAVQVNVKLSKQLSSLLRHRADANNLNVDEMGFIAINDLLACIRKKNGFRNTTVLQLEAVVANCPKQRFEYNENKTALRARYGHSAVAVTYAPSETKIPSTLFHGTCEKFLEAIQREGLKSMGRQYVHLSETTNFASVAGKRKGKLCLLQIDVVLAQEKGVTFQYAGDEVYLSTNIPPECFSVYSP